MTNEPIFEDIQVAEESLTIDLCHGNGTTRPNVKVSPMDELGKIAKEHAADLGIEAGARCQFTNKRTHESTSDQTLTVAGFGLINGDTLVVNDDACVA